MPSVHIAILRGSYEGATVNDAFELAIGSSLALDRRAAGPWCCLPYPGHPRGCPNYGQRDTCPPKAPLLTTFFDITQPMWLIVQPFDMAGHMRHMAQSHRGWSQAQLRCCLYWQGGVRVQLADAVRLAQWRHPGTVATMSPEAMGLNVFATMRKLGVRLSLHPEQIVYKVALLGQKQEFPLAKVQP